MNFAVAPRRVAASAARIAHAGTAHRMAAAARCDETLLPGRTGTAMAPTRPLNIDPATLDVAPPSPEAPPTWLRSAVREVLERSLGFHAMSVEDRRSLAQAMVKVSATAAALIAHEKSAQREIEQAPPAPARAAFAQAMQAVPAGAATPVATRPRFPAPLARAQDQQPDFGESAKRIAGVTQSVLNAVSFPRFVTDLINGVFKAMLDSSSQQMHMYVELMNNVSASLDGFERTQFSTAHVRQWVAERFPDQIEYDLPEIEPGEEPDPEEIEAIRLRLRGGASMPGEPELRATLGLAPEEPIEAANPEALVPLARRQIARQRQQMLATMVMMGMQRIVIDSGRINASMRFHIDTRSAANQDRGSQFGFSNRVKGEIGAKVGPWGASAEVENTVSYVSTERSQRSEEINTELDLNSSVEINFRTDYLPLNRMAAQGQADRIRSATLNPAAETAEAAAATAARQRRLETQIGAERDRSGALRGTADAAARPAPAPAALAAPRPATAGTGAAAGSAGPGAAAGAAGTGADGAGAAGAGAAGTGATGVGAVGAGAAGGRAAGPAPPGAAGAGAVGAGSGGAAGAGSVGAAPVGSAPAGANPAGTAGSAAGVGSTVGATVGGVAGGAAGGAAGTAIGGAIGTAVGPGGTAIGGAIGGTVGTSVGGAVGSAAGSAIGNAIGSAIGG